jgi:hypothetical protein
LIDFPPFSGEAHHSSQQEGANVTTVEMDLDTKLEPEKVVAALTDFTPRRTDIWKSLSPEYYEVYAVGDSWAEVREGNVKPFRTWAKERYDWSQPGKVVWTVNESNFCKPGSFVAADVTPGAGGGSHVHITWSREPSNLKGRFAATVIKMTKGAPIHKSLKNTLDGLAERGS